MRMNTWEAIAGLIILAIGLAVTWQSYNAVSQCNTILGKVATVINSIFGGTAAQACYNSQIGEVGGVIVALIGLVVLYAAGKKRRR